VPENPTTEMKPTLGLTGLISTKQDKTRWSGTRHRVRDLQSWPLTYSRQPPQGSREFEESR
jgi:hypothetical protein